MTTNNPLPPLLVSAQALRARLGDPRLALFDCRFSLADPMAGARAYAAGHLPGALYAHLDTDLSGRVTATTGRHPLPEPARLAHWLGTCGVGTGTEVVVYDDMGGAFAVRLWWLLRWLERTRVALLDGGFQAWQAIGGALTTEIPEPTPTTFCEQPDETRWITTKRPGGSTAGRNSAGHRRPRPRAISRRASGSATPWRDERSPDQPSAATLSTSLPTWRFSRNAVCAAAMSANGKVAATRGLSRPCAT